MTKYSKTAIGRTVLAVDTEIVIQDNFLGINAVYHGYAYMPDDKAREYTVKQRNTELARVQDMNLHIARTYYGTDFAWDKGSWNWNSERMTTFYKWIQAMKDRGVEVALQAAWWCPGDINGTLDCKPSPLVVHDDWNASIVNYAAWVSESLFQMIEVRGFTNLKYLMMFTEPNYDSGIPPVGMTGWECWLSAVEAVHERLVADGRRELVKFVGPNEGSTETSEMAGWVVSHGGDRCIDIYSSHNYDWKGKGHWDSYNKWRSDALSCITRLRASSKPFWFDEYGTGNVNEKYRWEDPDYGTQIGLANVAFLNAGVQSSLIWTLFDQQWPNNNVTTQDSFHDGVHRWGTAPTLRNSHIPYPCYYAFSLMSKYMGGPGTKVYKTISTEGVYIAATRQPDGNWSFLVVNACTLAREMEVNLSSAIYKDLYRYMYNPATIRPDEKAQMTGRDKILPAVANIFNDLIPAGAVVIYSSM